MLAGTPLGETGKDGTANGAAMRIAPVGIATPVDRLEPLIDQVELTCRVTHNTGEAIAAAAVVATVVSLAIEGQSIKESLSAALKAADIGNCRGFRRNEVDVAARIRDAVGVLGTSCITLFHGYPAQSETRCRSPCCTQICSLHSGFLSFVTEAELNWYYQFGVSEMFPEKWELFQAPIPEDERSNMIAAYRKRLTGDDPVAQLQAARAWSLWEGETITLLPDESLAEHFSDDRYALAFARIENHFFSHAAWLDDNQLLRDAHKLHGIPGAIIHGRYDMPCPARSAFALHRVWPTAEFHLIKGAGHAYSEPGILDQLIRATDRFAA